MLALSSLNGRGVALSAAVATGIHARRIAPAAIVALHYKLKTSHQNFQFLAQRDNNRNSEMVAWRLDECLGDFPSRCSMDHLDADRQYA
jgi:hypothetical protein